MKQIKEEEHLKFKTIKKTGYSYNKLFLFFTDDTFCIFSGSGWGDFDVEINNEDFETEPNTGNYADLKEIGLIDMPTFIKFENLRLKEMEERIRQREIDKLNELRKKYPNECV